ncbi:MAG: adenosine deaminase [Bdellovibrionota bacterium]
MTDKDLRAIPKVELHRHLECSIRFSTMRELIEAAGLESPANVDDFKKMYLVTEPMLDLEAVLRKFLATQKILSSEEILARITFEQIEDAYHEGIRILELRYAPTFVRQGHEHLSFEKIHRAILDGIARASHLPIAVGLIAIIQRVLPFEEGARVADFAIANKDTFLALDLADNEVGFDPAPFAPLFARAKKAGLRVTVHSGEAIFPGSAECVRTAIEVLGAERIGHGVQIAYSPKVLDFVRERGIPLELCPTSNWLTNAVPTLDAHPFKKLMNSGIKVTINSDDPGVFGIDLTNEYRVLHERLGLSLADFTRCNDIAAVHSFIPLSAKQKVWPRPIKSI